MKEQLSEEQIDKLFKFVKSKYVHYLDVQYEIVDHLASAIEDKQLEKPALSFERALSDVYSKFPITGFASLIVEKSSALKKFWLKKFLTFMLSYIKLPKIIIAAFLIYFFQIILSTDFFISPRQLYYSLVALSFCSVAYRYFYGFEFKKEFREKYLVTGTYLAFYGGVFAFSFYLPLDLSLKSASEIISYSPIQSWLLSAYITIATLWIHAYTFVFPEMLKQELSQKYGHLNLKLA